MLCNTGILINVTPIFIRALADSLLIMGFFCLIALHLLHYIDQTMLMSSNKHDVRFTCAHEETNMREAVSGFGQRRGF